jgi:hypothetical protein
MRNQGVAGLRFVRVLLLSVVDFLKRHRAAVLEVLRFFHQTVLNRPPLAMRRDRRCVIGYPLSYV